MTRIRHIFGREKLNQIDPQLLGIRISPAQNLSYKTEIIRNCEQRIASTEALLTTELQNSGFSSQKITAILNKGSKEPQLRKLLKDEKISSKGKHLAGIILNNMETIEREQESIRVFANSHQKMAKTACNHTAQSR